MKILHFTNSLRKLIALTLTQVWHVSGILFQHSHRVDYAANLCYNKIFHWLKISSSYFRSHRFRNSQSRGLSLAFLWWAKKGSIQKELKMQQVCHFWKEFVNKNKGRNQWCYGKHCDHLYFEEKAQGSCISPYFSMVCQTKILP